MLALVLSILLASEPASDFDRGRSLAAAGDLKGAIESFKQAARVHPDWGLVQVELAEALSRDGSDDVALESALVTARSLEPHSPRVWLLSGRFQERKGNAALAIESYLRAIELRPELIEARERLGTLLLEAERAAEAAPHLRAVVGARPDDRAAHARLAEACEQMGDKDCAESELRGLVEVAPRNAIYRRRLVEFYDRTGQAAKAAQEARKMDAPVPGRKLRPLLPSKR